MASDKLLDVTEQNFEQEVLNSPIPVMLDFTATWCGPCRAVAPIIDQLAEEYDQKAKFAKIDVDRLQSIAMRYHVRSVPTVLVVKGGKVDSSLVGAQKKAKYVAMIENAMG